MTREVVFTLIIKIAIMRLQRVECLIQWTKLYWVYNLTSTSIYNNLECHAAYTTYSTLGKIAYAEAKLLFSLKKNYCLNALN